MQRALRKLGLVRDIDFALYLPMRYEDETRIVRLADARDGETAQIEAVGHRSEVVYRPRRQLVVTVDDGSDTCQLRFFNFYPSQQKQLAVGARVRVRGEVRGGFLGRQMMHPAVKAAGTAAARGADAGLFDHRRPAAAGPAARGALRPGARAARRDPARGRRRRRRLGPAPGAELAALPGAGRGRWPRWRTAAIRPGSA